MAAFRTAGIALVFFLAASAESFTLDLPVHFHHRDLDKVSFKVTQHCVGRGAAFRGVQNFENETINFRTSNGRIDQKDVVKCFTDGLGPNLMIGLKRHDLKKNGQEPVEALRPSRLILAVRGDLTLTIKGSDYVMDDVRLGRSPSQWWIASRLCRRTLKKTKSSDEDLTCNFPWFAPREQLAPGGKTVFIGTGFADSNSITNGAILLAQMLAYQVAFVSPRNLCRKSPCRANSNRFRLQLGFKDDSSHFRRLQQDLVLV